MRNFFPVVLATMTLLLVGLPPGYADPLPTETVAASGGGARSGGGGGAPGGAVGARSSGAVAVRSGGGVSGGVAIHGGRALHGGPGGFHGGFRGHPRGGFRGSVVVGPGWGPGWGGWGWDDWGGWGGWGAYPSYFPDYDPTQGMSREEQFPTPEEPVYWYYCEEPRGYYPYVKSCPQGWMQVVPRQIPAGVKGEGE